MKSNTNDTLMQQANSPPSSNVQDPQLPRVSVIMPAYNARAFVAESIHSVLNQDYPNIELILVDDGSNDGTPEFAEQLDRRVRVLRQKNAGPAAARNRGLAAATGEFMAFLDADDVWLPRKVSLQVEYLQTHPEVGVVFGGELRWYAQADGSFAAPPTPLRQDEPLRLVAQHSGWIYTELLLDSVIHIITAMVRRTVVETVGGLDESLRVGEDYDFWLRVSRQYRIDELDRSLAYYRKHASSTTQVPRKENCEYTVLQNNITRYGLAGPDNIPVPSHALQARCFRLCFNHGHFHYHAGDPQVAQMAFGNALRHKALKPKAWVYWLLSKLKRGGARGNVNLT